MRALILGFGLGAAALPGSAGAQVFSGWGPWDNGGGWGALPGPDVRRSIAEQGFRVLGPLRRNGNVYVADVIDRRGRHERLIVAAADAQILQRFYVDDGRGPDGFGRPGYGPPPGDEADRDGLVPPADIPGVARRPPPPRERFGGLGETDPNDGAGAPPPLRGQPPIKTVKPRPRVVERTPDGATPDRPPAVEATPLAPAVRRPKLAEPPKAPPPATVASRPDPAPTPTSPPPAKPTAPPPSTAATPPPATAAAAPPRRLSDPLAIPGGPPPARSVSGAVTGAPAPAAKPGDVPAAPLD